MKYIVIIIVIVVAGYFGWYKSAPTIVTLDPLHQKKENLYKCKDDEGNVTYTDNGCVDLTTQELDIVIPTIDEAAAKRLKDRQLNSYPSQPRNTVSVVSANKPRSISNKCQSYKDSIKQYKNELRAGYTQSEGNRIQSSIKEYQSLYNNRCK